VATLDTVGSPVTGSANLVLASEVGLRPVRLRFAPSWGSLALAASRRIMAAMTRQILRQYRDPMEVLWISTAARLGMTLHRRDDIYAHWDGAGGLFLGTDDTLDADDCLAQMIFHEICHALVEGPESLSKSDWGLENIDARDLVREHATIRLQAALADAYGLRTFFSVTTDFRPYGDALDDAPLAPGDDPAIAIGRAAFESLQRGDWPAVWQDEIARALDATRVVAELIGNFAPPDSIWNR
jgi:hypothetical protein